MKIQPNSKLVMIGDSITDCQRSRQVGASFSEALGNGYVSYVNGLLTARYPEYCIQVFNKGVSGDTVHELKARWQTDVLDLQPDWLSICIGINDVWQHFDTQYQLESLVSLDEYRLTLDELLRATTPVLNGLILMTPYFVIPNRSDSMRAMMDLYGEVVRRLATQYQAYLVDTQASFDQALVHLDPAVLAWDLAHLTPAGHMILARAYLRAIDFEWGDGR